MKKIVNPREELREYRFRYDLLQDVPCTPEQNSKFEMMLRMGEKLPEGVYRYRDGDGVDTNEFYTVYESNFTPEETMEYLEYKQLALLKTIKNCVVFFTVLTILGLVSALILMN